MWLRPLKSSHCQIKSQRVEPQEENRDFEKDLSDNRPIPDWLSSVLNWLPSDNHDLGAAALEQGNPKEDIDEGITNQKTIELSVSMANVMALKDIPPLYTSPKIDGEGIWVSADTPVSGDGKPLIYKTVYRPSVEFPNTVVYMAVFDMSRLKPRLFIGRAEPGIYKVSNESTGGASLENSGHHQRHVDATTFERGRSDSQR